MTSDPVPQRASPAAPKRPNQTGSGAVERGREGANFGERAAKTLPVGGRASQAAGRGPSDSALDVDHVGNRRVETNIAGSTPTAHPRWPGLDGLRGIAVLLVVAGHAYVPFFPDGAIGVHVFFVLSGFLITGILLSELDRTGRIWFLGFYVRRALRLFPALGLLLVGYLIMTALVPIWGAHTLRNVAAVAFYFANLARIADWNLGLLGHTWSLSVEEHFYLVWPVLIFVARRLSPKMLARIATLATVAALSWRLVLPYDDYPRIYFGTDTNSAALLAGATLAAWRRAVGLPRISSGAAWTALLVLLALAAYPVDRFGGYTAAHLRYFGVVGTTVVLVVAATQNIGFLENRLLAWFGTISYSLYLWHYPLIAILLYRWPVEPPWVRGVTMAVLSVLFASASYYLVERKFLRLKPHRPSTFEASLLSPDEKHGLTGG